MSECGAEAWTGAVNRTLHTCEVTGPHDTHDDGHGFRWSTSATINITDVEPDAIVVRGDELRSGDYVFDTNGGTYKLVMVTRVGDVVRFRRNDMRQDRIMADETITILRYEEPKPQVWCAEHGKDCPYGCIR